MWTEKAIEKAQQAASQGMPVREAAIQFGVPKSTLHYRISGRVQHMVADGRIFLVHVFYCFVSS